MFLDPPYNKGLIEKAAAKLYDVTSDFCTLVCETSTTDVPPDEMFGFCVYRRYRYGKVSVSVYKKGQSNE